MLDSTHDDVLIQWKFDKPETFNEFNVTADSETQQGYSKCELLMSKQKTAIFRGNIVNKPANDGKTTYAGFAAMKSKRLYVSFFIVASKLHFLIPSHFQYEIKLFCICKCLFSDPSIDTPLTSSGPDLLIF